MTAISSFSTLSPIDSDSSCQVIAVPSRLYVDTRVGPLSGCRIAVEDHFQLKGVVPKTLSIAYGGKCTPAADSAAYLKQLLKLGAMVVGKTTIDSFNGTDGSFQNSADCIRPCNPRADGQQSTFSGAGAALAGYSWLDYSISTNISGEACEAADFYGLFCLRTTFGIAKAKEMVESVPSFDTINLFSRDLGDCHKLARETLDADKQFARPKQLLYSKDFFHIDDQDHGAIFEEFTQLIGRYLGIKGEEINIQDGQVVYKPIDVNVKGRDGHINKQILDKSVSTNHGHNVEKLKVFRIWLAENIMPFLDNAIMLIPHDTAQHNDMLSRNS